MTERKVSLKACGLGAAKRRRRPWRAANVEGRDRESLGVVPRDFLRKLGAKAGDPILVPEADLTPFVAGGRGLRRIPQQRKGHRGTVSGRRPGDPSPARA